MIGPGLTLAHVCAATRSIVLRRRGAPADPDSAAIFSQSASRTAKAIWIPSVAVLGVHVRERAGYLAGVVFGVQAAGFFFFQLFLRIQSARFLSDSVLYALVAYGARLEHPTPARPAPHDRLELHPCVLERTPIVQWVALRCVCAAVWPDVPIEHLSVRRGTSLVLRKRSGSGLGTVFGDRPIATRRAFLRTLWPNEKALRAHSLIILFGRWFALFFERRRVQV